MTRRTQLLSLLQYINRGTLVSFCYRKSLTCVLCRNLPANSSQLYQTFDTILLLAHGQAVYSGPGSFAPVDYFNRLAGTVPPYKEGYNVADYLLEVASDPPVSLFQTSNTPAQSTLVPGDGSQVEGKRDNLVDLTEKEHVKENGTGALRLENKEIASSSRRSYATTFLTQFEVLSGREWKILRR